jgi:hypothetical protein
VDEGERDGFGKSDSSGKGKGRGGFAPDGSVEASGSKAKALPDVLQEQITFDLPLERDLWPIRQHTKGGKSVMSSPSILGAISTPAQMYPS